MDGVSGTSIGYTAPVGSVDAAAFDDQGGPEEIHGYDYCLPWCRT
jgi:hypothetical protein